MARLHILDRPFGSSNAPNLALLKFASTSSDPAVPPFYYGWYSCSGAASCTRSAPLPPEIEDEIILTVGVAPETPPAVYLNSATMTWDSASTETSLPYRVVDKAIVEVSKDDLWDPVIVGALGEESIVYVVTVENNGPSTARDVIVTDDLPSGTQLGDDVIVVPSYAPLLPAVCSGPGSNPVVCALGDMPAGSTAELHLAIQVTDVALCDSTVTNNVSADWTDFFGGAVASPGQDEFSTVTDLLCQGDLDLKKTGNRVVAVGADLDYVLRVTNTGPSPIPAGDVTLEDVIPSGLTFVSFLSSGPCDWSSGTPVWTNLQPFPAGAECRLEIKTTVTQAATTDLEKGIIFNEAQVHDLDGIMDQLEPLDPDLNDNMDSATALVRSADMRMQCGATLACVCPGDVFRYTVRRFNDGTATAENVTVSLTLPPEVTYIGDSIGCGPGLTDCPLGAIQPGTYVDFEAEVGVDASAVDMDELAAGIAAARADSSEILEGTVVLSVDQAARKYLPLIVLEPTD